MEDNNFKVTFGYTAEDCFNIVCDSLLYIYKYKGCFLVLISFFAIITGLTLITLKHTLVPIILVLIGLIYFPFIIIRQFKSTYDCLKNITNMVCELDRNGVKITNNAGESFIDFKLIKQVVNAKSTIAIYIDKNTAFLIPKRAFKQPENAENFFDNLSDFYADFKLKNIN